MGQAGRRLAVLATLVACMIALGAVASMLAGVVPAAGDGMAFAGMQSDQLARRYPIIYKLDGGAQPRAQVRKIAAGSRVEASKLKTPKRPGYVFIGWYADADLTKRAFSVAGVSASSKRTVYAKWAKVRALKVFFEPNGGELDRPHVGKFKNSEAFRSLPAPVRAGYDFSGWYSDGGLANRVTTIGKGASRSPVLYAKWRPVEYDIAYAANGGQLPAGCARSYDIETPSLELPTPVRAGYSFMGWYSDQSLSNLVASIPTGSQGNKVLYAKWRERVVVAHRGLCSAAPENSIAAFRAAHERGFKEVETDVRFTSDGVAVLVHDETIPVWADRAHSRVKNVRVSTLAYEELQSLDYAGEKSGGEGRNLTTFAEAMMSCADMGLRVTVHLKAADEQGVRQLVDLAREHGMADEVRWFSSSLTTLWHARQAGAGVHYVYSHELTERVAEEALMLAADGADVEVSTRYDKLSDSDLRPFKDRGVSVRAWGFKDETELVGLDQYVSTVLLDGLANDCVPDYVAY